MRYQRLGESGPRVSRACLGTMNFGLQCDERASHAQLDLALERGVNFIDTAELYPSPPAAGTFGLSERYVGSWLARAGVRDRVVLATKVAGRSRLPWLRPWQGGTRLDARNIEMALDGSLRRLGTDYIDLYQPHWPDRRTNIFGQLGYRHRDDDAVSLEETLGVLGRLVEKGKIRYVGLCNETSWGLMSALSLAGRNGLPRIVSVQNPYNLLSRVFEIGLAEIAHRERVGLLAYAPLSMGMLTGKYLGGSRPAGARLSEHSHFERYLGGGEAAARYVALARKHGLEPAQMALAFVAGRPFTASVLLGASSLEQLATNLDALDLSLPPELLDAIEAVHREMPNPVP